MVILWDPQHCPGIKDHIPLCKEKGLHSWSQNKGPLTPPEWAGCLHLSWVKGPQQIITGKDGRRGMVGVALTMGCQGPRGFVRTSVHTALSPFRSSKEMSTGSGGH